MNSSTKKHQHRQHSRHLSDDLIKKAGRIAVTGFDRLITKGDHNLRGRKQDEITEMLCQLASEIGKRSDCEIILNAEETFEREIADIDENEVVVFFYEKLQPVLEIEKARRGGDNDFLRRKH